MDLYLRNFPEQVLGRFNIGAEVVMGGRRGRSNMELFSCRASIVPLSMGRAGAGRCMSSVFVPNFLGINDHEFSDHVGISDKLTEVL